MIFQVQLLHRGGVVDTTTLESPAQSDHQQAYRNLWYRRVSDDDEIRTVSSDSPFFLGYQARRPELNETSRIDLEFNAMMRGLSVY